ncbi:Ephrin type-A receptor 3 [Holothuria leucospilota]|uniref:Ephrin type-A receptor 3 n=1 Tax=Holothuria leucospilota TaxID=206669 RepID=A0A9Q1CPM3_HOLLE|nr:Ephrin type-A receptor 3 [Holothuria leucospilota]
MKSKKDCSINDLPPEALHRNEYTQASDVWCVAVILWKLMTYDSVPVVLQTIDEKNSCSITQDWPARHLELKNPILFECWMYDDNFRPSVNKLRSSFEEVIRTVQAFSISEDTKESMTDLYISMDGIKTTLQHNSEKDRTHLSLE